MKILVINAGSSSLKFQLIDMDNESVIAKGSRKGTGNREQRTGMAADAILNNANLPGVSGAERPDL